MRMPALPKPKEMMYKRKLSVVKIARDIVLKRIPKKRPFVRVPPRT